MDSPKFKHEFPYRETNYTKLGNRSSSDMCKSCIEYYDHLFNAGITKERFPIKCSSHVMNSLGNLDQSSFTTEEEYIEALTVADPVTWALDEFGWEARWYQEWVLSCTSNLKAYRWGRRCLGKGTLVATPTGPIAIEDIQEGQEVYDEHGKIIKVIASYKNGIKSVHNLSVRGIIQAKSTLDHVFLTRNDRPENKKQRQLKVSDFGKHDKICRTEIVTPMGSIDIKNAYALGCFIGDGCCTLSGLVISSADNSVVEKIEQLLGSTARKCKGNHNWYFSSSLRRELPYYKEFCQDKKAHQKILDISVLKTWNRTSLLKLLAGIIDTDGSVLYTKKEICISISMQALEVIKAIQYLLLALWQVNVNITVDNRIKYKNGPVYVISLKHIYHCTRILKELDPYLVVDRKKYKGEYSSLVPNNFNPECIGVSVDYAGEEETFDITVDSPTNLYLLANGMVCHNSGKTLSMCVETLHHTFTTEGAKVLVCAPREAQINLFFEELFDLINKGKSINGSIARTVRSPAFIEFKNGSRIKGFTLNPNAGADSAVTIRGQDASLIIVDETNFISDDDLDVLLAIKASKPNCKIIVSSTPTGSLGKFYQICTQKDIGWKEFWVIAHESPNYTEETESFFRKQFTAEKFVHEIYAEFGDTEDGVFKGNLIEASLQDYDMNSIDPVSGGTYILGIDWNKSHGTHFVILQKIEGSLKLVRKIIVPESEFTQTSAVNKVIELNEEWKFEYIFVDSGYGHVQVELLKQYGMKNPSSKLNKKIKPLTMNKQLSLKDVTSNEDIKKFTKPFIVQQTTKLLEDNRLILPRSEDQKVRVEVDSDQTLGLVTQMRAYKVENYSVYGQPTYTKENEHTLMAYIIACGGYVMETDDLFKSLPAATRIIGIELSNNPEDPENGRAKLLIQPREGEKTIIRDLDIKGKNISQRVNKVVRKINYENSGNQNPRTTRFNYKRKTF